LALARRCSRAWAFRYLLGLRKPEIAWAAVTALEKPTDREALRDYNRLRRPALGKECHTRPERYYRGEDVCWTDGPGTIMLAGLHLLPHPSECSEIECEGEIAINVDGVQFTGYLDLLVNRLPVKGTAADYADDLCAAEGRWLLVDHKTTYSFDYVDRDKTIKSVKTAAELKADIQANLYAYAVMRRKDLRELDCRWVYYRTEGVPAAIAVDFTITWADAERVARDLAAQAKTLLLYVDTARTRLPLVREYVATFAANPAACDAYGGCEYHVNRGGPCTPPTLTPGARMQLQRARQKTKAARPPTEKRKRRTMGFRDAKQAADRAKTEAPEAPEEQAATEDAPPPPAATRKPRATRRTNEDGPDIALASGDTSIALPRNSPLYAQAAAVFAALYPEG
jgi:hypothetical protein